MNSTKEIEALMHLLDDPDKLVFDSVSNKIMSYGTDIIPQLQQQLNEAANLDTQERIEEIINKISFSEIKLNLQEWASHENPILLNALIILCRYRNQTTFDENEIRKGIKNIYQSTWLEINNYLSPIEQINVLSSILYNMYRLESKPLDSKLVNTFYIDKLLETKEGNGYSLGLLYLVVSSMLDIPIYAVELPDQF